MFTFSEKPNGILTILEPFWALSSVTHVRTNGGQTGPAGPGPHAGHSHPACGLRPPRSNYLYRLHTGIIWELYGHNTKSCIEFRWSIKRLPNIRLL